MRGDLRCSPERRWDQAHPPLIYLNGKRGRG